MSFNSSQIANAKQIFKYFHNKGWSTQAICGMLGNFSIEDPPLRADEWEIGMPPWGPETGYGIAQWTPATHLTDWCNIEKIPYNKLSSQCACIQYELTHGVQFFPSDSYSMTASEYMVSTDSPYTLGLVWLANYERPANPYQPERGNLAEEWYSILSNLSEGEINSIPTPSQSNNSIPVTGGGEKIVVTVEAGDTLSVIAEQYGVTIRDILNWNPNITNPNDIYVGEQIIIYTNSNEAPSAGNNTPSQPSINTGIDYNSNGGINIGSQPTYNWNAKVTTSQINILNFDGSSSGDYYTSAGDHITILDIAGDQQMALIQYPDQSAGIYQQGWIPSSYISQDYMNQTFYSLWTNNVSNQEIIFHNGVIAATTLTEGTEVTFLYTVEYNNTIYACIAYIDNNGNPESGYVPWSSGTLNMIGPDIPYYAKYGTEAVELTYSSNAVTQATSINIVDINGISIPNSYTTNGDNILILNVYMEEELVFIEYPDQALGVYYTGFISAENLINGNISINDNSVSWNDSSGTYEMYGISTSDILYSLQASQNIQYLYETSGGYACILFNNNDTTDLLLETGYTSISNGTFNRN